MPLVEIELFSKEWSERIAEWKTKFQQQVAHLPILDDIWKEQKRPAAELVELTICGEMDTQKQDCANPEERKPVTFGEWQARDKEDGGGQQHYQTECGKFVRMTVYVIGRAFGSAVRKDDTTLVVCVAAIKGDGTAYPPKFESLQQIVAENIAQYKVLERYQR